MKNINTNKKSNISLVIPSYNRAYLIAETLRSALTQTSSFDEIIVVDDGSTDDTASVLATFGNAITLISTPNQGVQAARNTGVNAAHSEMVALCDSDDLLEPDFVKSVTGWMEHFPQTDIFFSNFFLFDDEGIKGEKFSQGPVDFFAGSKQCDDIYFEIPELYARTVKFQPFFPTGTVFRKKFYLRIGGYNTAFKGVGGEDWEFTLRALSLGQAATCARPLARVRKHSGNDSADVTRVNLGDAQILEYALLHHKNATRYQELILQSIQRRRMDAFNATYAAGQFDQAMQISKQLLSSPKSINFKLKKYISTMPEIIRRPLWLYTQRKTSSTVHPAIKV